MAREAHGIDCDPVPSRVLVLNLPHDGDAPCERLAQAAEPEPLLLTLRSLTGSFRMAVPASDVYVCENPSVLITAADQLGNRMSAAHGTINAIPEITCRRDLAAD
jgi:hypothetical protein